MKYPLITMVLLASLIAGALPAHAVDPDCLEDLNQTANRERQRIGVYVGQLGTLSDSNPWASRAVSICNGALARADNYYHRMEDNEEFCDTGTTYVDSQIAQLYRSATSTCREQFDDFTRSLPDFDQREMRQNADQALRGK